MRLKCGMQKNEASVTTSSKSHGASPLVLDIRPIFAAGGSPCGIIDETVASLSPGQPLVLFAPFEPIPLFTKLAAQGFDHRSEPQDDGSWKITFKRVANVSGIKSKASSCCC